MCASVCVGVVSYSWTIPIYSVNFMMIILVLSGMSINNNKDNNDQVLLGV